MGQKRIEHFFAARIYENAPSRQGRPRIARQFIGGIWAELAWRGLFVNPPGEPADNSPPINGWAIRGCPYGTNLAA